MILAILVSFLVSILPPGNQCGAEEIQEIYIGPEYLKTNSTHSRVGDVVLGGLFPIHQNTEGECGRILDLGIQRAEAMVLAIDIINRDTSLLPGVKLGFEIRDTCAVSTLALDQSLHFLSVNSLDLDPTSREISGVVGAAASSVSIAVANLFRLFNIPQVSYASTSKQLSDKSRYDYFLRTVPPDQLQARAMAAIARHFNWTYISLVSTEGAYGQDGIKAFVDEYTATDNMSDTSWCVAADIVLSLEAAREEYDDAVSQLIEPVINNATVVLLFGQLATAEGLLGAVQRRKLIDPTFSNMSFTWIASDAWADSIPDDYYNVAAGLLGVSPVYHLSDEFDSYFTSLNPLTYYNNPWFREYWEDVFHCTFNNGSNSTTMCNPTVQSLASSISGYKQNSKVTFTMDAVLAFARALDAMIKDHCNSSVLCPAIVDIRGRLDGELLLQYLKVASFEGYSADSIQFDDSGDPKGGYLIRNLVRDSNSSYSFKTVGYWQDGNLDISNFDEITWNTKEMPLSYCSEPCENGEYPQLIPGHAECCWICTPCQGIKQVSDGLICNTCPKGYLPNDKLDDCEQIPPDYLGWLHPWAIIIMLLSLVGCCMTLVVIIIFVINRNSKIVKATSRELSSIILFGIFWCYALPFFYIGQPLAFTCGVTRFGLGFGFSVCFGALLVKTNRIHRIFNRQQKTLKPPPFINPQSQVVFVGIIVFFQVAIAIVWLIFEQPGTILITADYSAELRCAANVYAGLSVSLAYNCILLICSTYFAFRTRSIPSEFNETKLINLTCYTMCVIWVAFIPSYFGTASLGSVYTTSSQVLAIVLSASCILGILFVPKVYVLYRRDKSAETEEQGQSYLTSQPSTASPKQMSRSHSFSVPSVNSVVEGNTHRKYSLPLSGKLLCTVDNVNM